MSQITPTFKKLAPLLKYFRRRPSNVTNTLIYNKQSQEISQIVSQCTELQKQFKPFKLLSHHHIQTTVAALKKSPIEGEIHREMFQLKDDYSVWVDRVEPLNSNEETPSIFIMPGLASGLHGCGISDFINYSLKNNFRCLVFNYLDHNKDKEGVKTIIPGVTHSIPDIFKILEELTTKYPKSKIYGVGFSLGSNILLKFCGGHQKTYFEGLISVSNPFDLHVAASQLQKTVNSFLYDRIFMKKRMSLYERNPHILEQKNIDPSTLKNLKSTMDLDRISAKLTGIDDVQEFYNEFSCKNSLEHIKVPLLCLNAIDDPISHPKAIPIDSVEKNPNVIIYLANGGGHLGFFDNWLGYPTFIERSSIEFLKVIHEKNKKN